MPVVQTFIVVPQPNSPTAAMAQSACLMARVYRRRGLPCLTFFIRARGRAHEMDA